MSTSSHARYGALICLFTLLGGCTVTPPAALTERDASVRDDECRGRRSACLYEGSYEKGERDYAEEEAKRLNRAQAARLRRGW